MIHTASHSPIYYVGQPAVMRTQNAAWINTNITMQTASLCYRPSAPSPRKSSPALSSPSPSPSPPPSDVPTAVATLLGLTRQLQDVLRLWSDAAAGENQVSDAFVLVGMQFNATVNAFQRHRIDMSDLLPIPNDLRLVLEDCLGLQPSPAVFDHYIPQVRTVLFRLLQGLQKKQGPYWRAVEDVSPRWSVPVRWSR